MLLGPNPSRLQLEGRMVKGMALGLYTLGKGMYRGSEAACWALYRLKAQGWPAVPGSLIRCRIPALCALYYHLDPALAPWTMLEKPLFCSPQRAKASIPFPRFKPREAPRALRNLKFRVFE